MSHHGRIPFCVGLIAFVFANAGALRASTVQMTILKKLSTQ
jgi:hypothetical protein